MHVFYVSQRNWCLRRTLSIALYLSIAMFSTLKRLTRPVTYRLPEVTRSACAHRSPHSRKVSFDDSGEWFFSYRRRAVRSGTGFTIITIIYIFARRHGHNVILKILCGIILSYYYIISFAIPQNRRGRRCDYVTTYNTYY